MLQSIKRNAVLNLLGSGTPFILGVITIPYLMKHLGLEAFGVLTLIWALIGYFSLFDFGLGRALTQQVAACLATGESEKVAGLVKYGTLLTLGTGLIGGMLLGSLAGLLGYKWLNVSASLQQATVQSLRIASVGIPLATLTAGLRGVIEAYEDFTAINIFRILLGVANFALPVLCILYWGPSLPLAVGSLVMARLMVSLGHLFIVSRKILSNRKIDQFRRVEILGLLSFGVWMTLSNVIGPLMVVADRFIISSVLGAGVVAYYTVPFDSLFRLLVIPGAVASALFPRMASLIAVDLVEAKRLYRKATIAISIIMGTVVIFVIISAYWGLKIWMGLNFAQNSWIVSIIIVVGIFFNSLALIPITAIQAVGNAKMTAVIHASEFVIYLPLLYLSLCFLGLWGAALIWTVRVFVDYVILSVCAKKYVLY